MLFSFFLSLCVSEVITCSHDFMLDKNLRSDDPIPFRETLQIPEPTGGTTTPPSTEEQREKGKFYPIRIHFDMKSIEDIKYDSNQQCSRAGAPQPKCLDTDVLTQKKRDVIIQTFKNVQTFLHDNITASYNDEVDKESIGDFNYPTGGGKSSRKDHDLFITVWARPFGKGNSGLAFASSSDYGDYDKRPIRGEITINPSKIPDEAQDFTSGNRQFITTVLHEINHILSFSNSLFDKWRMNYPNEENPGDTNSETYTNSFVYTDIEGNILPDVTESNLEEKEKTGVIHKFLHTPELTKFVNERFNIPADSPRHDLGLEIEDGGGRGTRGSHPNERLFFTDLMQGRTYGPAYISPIFYSTLIDTHWYKPTEQVKEHMAYLDQELDPTIEINENILFQSPVKSYPASYLCKERSYTACFYDYIYAGVCAIKDTTEIEGLEHKNYYNPDNNDYMGQDDLLDYVPTVLPWLNCRDPGPAGMGKRGYKEENEHLIYGESYSNTSVCAMSTLYKSNFISTFSQPRCFDSFCGTDGRVRITVENITKVCDKDGRKLKFKGFSGAVVCPPSNIVCANRKDLRDVLAITALTPDRGPIDGQNLLNIKGVNFNKYKDDGLNITIGGVKCNVLMLEDTDILCQMENLTEQQQKDNYQQSFPIIAVSGEKESKSTFEYTFTGRQYNAGHISAKPALFLLALSSAIAAFFF